MAYSPLRLPVVLSIVASILTIGIKTAAYLVTDSVGLLSDALESGVNFLAALAAAFSLWYSAKPADPTHTFGHEKIEFFSSGLEGILVLFAGLGTVGLAIFRLANPQPLTELNLGLAFALIAAAINAGVGYLLLKVGRKHQSIVLEANGHHLMTDVWTTFGVVAGLCLVMISNFKVLDSLMAMGVGLLIVRTGGKLLVRSFDGLMDHALPQTEQEQIRKLLRVCLPENTDFHALRTREAGRTKFAEIHLLVPGQMSVQAAHDLAHDLEAKVLKQLPELVLNIHVEPIEDKSSFESRELAALGEVVPPGVSL